MHHCGPCTVVALAHGRFFSRTRRRNVSPHGEKDPGDDCNTGRYISVCQLIDTRTARYRVVSPIGAVSAPLPPEIDLGDRFRAVVAEGGRKKKREKNFESIDPSPVRSVVRVRFLLPAQGEETSSHVGRRNVATTGYLIPARI
ncbi:hypothetical protein GW17_00008023 [Ensete ventricosum]|nr:hypothetical protein GW17_00008023 [Ensete ventricosum]